jgi:hypothetical protein
MGMTGSPVNTLPQLGLPGLGGTPSSIPGSPVATNTLAQPVATPQAGVVAPNPNAPVIPGTVPIAQPITPAGNPTIGSAGFTAIYGNDTGNAVANLLNSETPGNADSMAQSIIAANAPNVAQGQANLQTGLAASGISPSSSVSAIENANYQGQVAQQDQSEIAQINMDEQKMQQQLLENLLPGQQQRETDSSGWSIFGDVMKGIGDIGGIAGDVMGLGGLGGAGGSFGAIPGASSLATSGTIDVGSLPTESMPDFSWGG